MDRVKLPKFNGSTSWMMFNIQFKVYGWTQHLGGPGDDYAPTYYLQGQATDNLQRVLTEAWYGDISKVIKDYYQGPMTGCYLLFLTESQDPAVWQVCCHYLAAGPPGPCQYFIQRQPAHLFERIRD